MSSLPKGCYAHSKRPIADRFWSKVNKDGPIVRPELGPCWVWTASLLPHGGYGSFGMAPRQTIAAHRASWSLEHGDPGEMHVCHKCDNRLCVRPEHLFLGDRFDNMGDAAAKGRTTKGTRHWRAKLTDADVLSIRSKAAAGMSQRDLAAQFGVIDETIRRIVTRANWTHL